MGTSKSQPSPRGNNDAGRAWKKFDKDLATACAPKDAVNSVLEAYSGEYKSRMPSVLVDNGVEIIESLLKDFKSENRDYYSLASEFIIAARHALAANNSNSFLSELALSSVGSSILKPKESERMDDFRKNYLAKLVDYTVSRDLPRLFGTTNLVNHAQIESFVREVRRTLDSESSIAEPLKDFLAGKIKKLEGND